MRKRYLSQYGKPKTPYCGVCYMRNARKWRVTLKGHYLGVFDDLREAVRASAGLQETLYGSSHPKPTEEDYAYWEAHRDRIDPNRITRAMKLNTRLEILQGLLETMSGTQIAEMWGCTPANVSRLKRIICLRSM